MAVPENSQEVLVAGGIDAQPAEMTAVAGALRTAGQTVGTLGREAGQAVASAGAGVLDGPLTSAIDRLTGELQRRTQELGALVVSTGTRVDLAAGNYSTSDAAASRDIAGTFPTTSP